jgi:bifunctional non-homologous end joining protein LigD
LPLVERKRRLRKLIPKQNARLHYVDHIATEGEFVFNDAAKAGMEGVMAKRLSRGMGAADPEIRKSR